MMRRTSLFLLGAAAGAFAVALIVQPKLLLGQTARAAVSDTYRQLNLFGDIFEHVRAQYVEKPNDAKLIESAINGMLNALDPHSAFLDAKNFSDMKTQTRGEFGGLGIEVTMEDGVVKVVSPMDGTPAARAGIQPNDLITHLNDEQVKGLTLEQAVDKMRAGEFLDQLRVQRKGADKPIEIKIVREVISIRNVRHRIEGGDIGYIRITSFQGERTLEQLRSPSPRSPRKFPPTSSRAISSTCATTAADCSTRRSRSPTRSSSAAKSSRRGAAISRTPSVTTRGRAISRTASR